MQFNVDRRRKLAREYAAAKGAPVFVQEMYYCNSCLVNKDSNLTSVKYSICTCRHCYSHAYLQFPVPLSFFHFVLPPPPPPPPLLFHLICSHFSASSSSRALSSAAARVHPALCCLPAGTPPQAQQTGLLLPGLLQRVSHLSGIYVNGLKMWVALGMY